MFRVRVVGEGWSGGPSLNTFYFDIGAPQQDSAQLCLDRVHTAFAGVAPIYPAGVDHHVLPEVDIINHVTGELTDTQVGALPAVVPGGAADGSQMSPAVALLLQLRTGTFSGGRRLRGRAFLSPLYSQMTDGAGTPTATALARGIQMGADLLDEGIVGPALVVWRRPKAGQPGIIGPVTSVTVPDRFAVLRSRRP